MATSSRVPLALLLTAATAFSPAACTADGSAGGAEDTNAAPADQMSGIEGTYQLVSRELPDGTVLRPPEIGGFMTFTAGLRHFQAVLPDGEGNRVLISFVARYSLTDSEYRHTVLYAASAGDASAGISHVQDEDAVDSPVTRSAGAIEFQDPSDGPMLRFDAAGVVATDAEGAFVDRWERIE